MQRDKFKVLLYLKKSGLDKSGQAPIMGRITYGRTMAQFSCKLSCDPDLWNSRESRLNGKSREAVVTNGKLERLLLSVHSAYRRLCERGAAFTATDIKELFQGSMQSQTTFLKRYDRMFEEMEKLVGVEIKASSLYAYRSTRKHLQHFIHHQFHSSDIAFGQVGDDFLSQLEHYIKGVSGLSQGSYRRIALYSKKIPLSAHVGRHTFATLITLERGVPIETVSQMLGHGSIKTTERYAHVTPKKLFDEFERFLSFTEDLRLSL